MIFNTELPNAYAVYQKGIARGYHFGAQVYISRGGECLADETLGVRDAEGHPLSREDLMLWKSAAKPVAAVAIAQLNELGKLEFDDPVSEFIPEFAQGGKDPITIKHLLTHQGGFRVGSFALPPPAWNDAIAQICAMPLDDNWVIGETAGYHALTSWYILGEIVHRIDGRSYSDYIRDEIFAPLNMDHSFIGMSDSTYDTLVEQLAPICNTARGKNEWLSNTEREWVTPCVPGANGRGPARELGRFYEALLNDGEGILHKDSVANLVTRHREGLPDLTFRSTMDWGLGFILNSNRYGAESTPYGYGLHTSEASFGHGGRETSSAFADPDNDLVVIAVFNGMPGEPRHNQRVRDFNSAVYEDLGLV